MNLWPWHWNASAASVTFDWTEGVSRYEGWVDDHPRQLTDRLQRCWECLLPRANAALQALESIPPEVVSRLQAAVWEAAPRLLYGEVDTPAGVRSATPGTAVETLLPHLFAEAAKLRARAPERAPTAQIALSRTADTSPRGRGRGRGRSRGRSRGRGLFADGKKERTQAAARMSRSMEQPCSRFHQLHLGVCHCHCVLIDVGLNRGRSLMTWPRYAAQILERKGQRPWRLLRHCLSNDTSRTTCYYGIEANPAFDAPLGAMESSLRAQGVAVKLFTSTAFTIADAATATATLYVQPPLQRDGVLSHALSSTLRGSNAMFERTRGAWRADHSTKVSRVFERVTVRAMDARRFLGAATRLSPHAGHGGLAALKIDCEGCEFDVLPTLVMNSTPSLLCRLGLLALEPHGRVLPPAEQRVATETADAHLLRTLREHLDRPGGCHVTVMEWG